MDIAFSPDELAFREEVRAFFDEQFDDELVARLRSDNFKEAICEWQQRLHKKGWIAANWPVEYG
ncbi:MAG: acyl-CoA dehydrogenase family protein, partial [Luminiphilus sp.]